MPTPPTPISKDVTIACDDMGIVSVDFKIPADIIEKVATTMTDVPDWLEFLKTAADFWAKTLAGASNAKEAIKELLGKVELSENLSMNVSGDCDTFDAIDIEMSSHMTAGVISNPLTTIEVQVDTGKSLKTKSCKVGDKQGRCRARQYLVSWYVKTSFKGVVYSWLAQVDKVTVSSCCCPLG